MWKLRIYTGYEMVQETAQLLHEAGFNVTNIGTQYVYVVTDKDANAILSVLGQSWNLSDIRVARW